MKCKLFIMLSRGSYLVPSLCQVCLVPVLFLYIVAVIEGSRLETGVAAADWPEQATESNVSGAKSRHQSGPAEKKMKTLEEFLAQAQRISVGQRHTARFDCDLNESTSGGEASQGANGQPLVWLRLNRTAQGDDIKLISLDNTLITADRRFRAQRLSSERWQLSLDNVQPHDTHAYFLCQIGGGSPCGAGSTCPRRGFAGGALLTVLAPPQIIVEKTSPSLVQAHEFEPLKLHCKVASEPRSQVSWKREYVNGSSLTIDPSVQTGYQQRFKEDGEHLENQLLSVVSSELILSKFTRQQAGVYLCIASNGVQPGVSQRIGVRAVVCKSVSGEPESCEPQEVELANSKGSTGSRQQPVAGPQSTNGTRRMWRTQNQSDKSSSRVHSSTDLQSRVRSSINQPHKVEASGVASSRHQPLIRPLTIIAAALVAPLLTCIITSSSLTASPSLCHSLEWK